MRTNFPAAMMMAALLLAPATVANAHGGHGGGGGGGHGGGGGGFGGGGHGGGGFGGGGHGGGGSFSGGGMHSGGGSMMRSYSGGGGSSRSFSGGNFSGGSNAGRSFSGTPRTFSGGSGTGHSSFMHNNFPNQSARSLGTGGQTHQVNRFNGSLSNSSFNRGNSFVHSQNINSRDLNHWSHQGNWNKNLSNNNLANHSGNNNWNKGNWSNNNWNHGNWGGNWNRRNNFFFYPGLGFGGLWGGWGWPYYGWGYGYGYPLYGYGNSGGYGYGNYGYPSYSTTYAAAPDDAQLAQADQTAADFTDQGEADFKAGRYDAAIRDWQHAMVDDPKNGALVMLMAQALLALGKYDEAAGATQAAMQMLPDDKWGVVISNYSQLYGNPADYNNEIKALEKARDEHPDSPAIRFLLGFHFGYLGYPKHAVRELDQAMTIAPTDFGARKARDVFAAKWPEAPPLPAAAVDAWKEFEKNAQPPAGGAPAAQPPAAQPPAQPAPAAEPGTPS